MPLVNREQGGFITGSVNCELLMLHIDNPISSEYTGNHYECYGDSKPRTKYGQVSVPSHFRGMSDHQINSPLKHIRHERAIGSTSHGFFV
jgi:hypothetical protein